MKKILVSLFVLTGALFLTGCTMPNSVDIIEYNDNMVDVHDLAIDSYNDFTDFAVVVSLLEEDLKILEDKRIRTIDAITEYKIEIEEMGAYKGNIELNDGFVEFLDILLDVLYTERTEVTDLWMQRAVLDEDASQEDIDREAEVLTSIDAQIEKVSDYTSKIQESFSAEYGYELIFDEFPELDVELDTDWDVE